MQRLEAALKEATAFLKRKGVRYADARFVETLGEDIQVKDQAVEALVRETDRGVGVRVLWRGAWGFASTADLSDGAVHEAAEAALRTARASALANTEKSRLAPQEPHEGEWRGPCARDPFQVPLDEKLEEIFRATEILKKNPAVKTAEGSMNFARRTRLFVSTDGACLRQVKTTSGAGVSATAILNGEFQRRSYPTSQGGNHASRGYEFVEAMHLPSHAERVAEEAAALLRAPECPYGKRDLIVGSSQLSLQVHESCGHPIELDRVLGSEVSLAGGSFLTLDKWKKLRYGSPGVSITADATIEGGLGSFGFDDEGVPARRTPVVKEGLFVNYLTSRETARALGLRSNGSMRADGWNVMPLIRMGPREPRRRHAGRRPRRHEQILVHRRPAPQLPVRVRDRLAHRARPRHGHRQEPALHGRDARVLERVRRRVRPKGVEAVGRRQLRQGRAHADRKSGPRHGARPLPPNRGGRQQEIAARAARRARGRGGAGRALHYTALRESVTGVRHAFQAGRSPPRSPIRAANPIPASMICEEIRKANATSTNVCQFAVPVE
jgi:TldD protein